MDTHNVNTVSNNTTNNNTSSKSNIHTIGFSLLIFTFILGFICEQIAGNRNASIPLGILAIVCGFPVPFIFLRSVLKKPIPDSQGNIPNRKKGLVKRLISAGILYAFSLISATILLFNAFNHDEPVKGLVVVTSSLLGYSSLILYVDSIE